MTTWRQRLREELAKSGKTRSQVCQEAGLNPAYLTQILEQKGATPRIDNLAKLALVLDTTVSYLVEGVDLDSAAIQIVGYYGSLSDERKDVALTVLRDMAEASSRPS
ncbi:MAG: helix-turn-helix transcriptional regulator [Pseudomonadota bacterium]